MVNLSNQELNQHEEILALGLNFALTPASIEITDIIAHVEQGLSKAKSDKLRMKIRQILQQSERRQPPNLTKADLTAVKTFTTGRYKVQSSNHSLVTVSLSL